MQNDRSEKYDAELSHQQLLMWTGQQLDSQQPIYNMGFWIEIPAPIDGDAFKTAFNQVVSQSTSHRSVIKLHQGIPRWHLLREINHQIEVLDFSQQPEARSASQKWCEQRVRRMMDLSQCLFDTALHRLGENSYAWFINHHHLISDAWSSTQLLRLQSEAYLALLNGEEMPKVIEEVSGECESLFGTTKSAANDEACLVAFFGQQQSSNRGSSASERLTVLSAEDGLQRQLDGLVESEWARSFSSDLSRFNIMLTLLVTLLNRISGQSDICVGVPFHNRLNPEQKRSLGLFITLHPILVHVDNKETFQSLFEKVKTETTNYLKEATSGTKPEVGRGFNAIFNFINASFGSFAGAEVNARWLHPGCHDREHALRMHVEKFGNESRIKFDLNDQVFDREHKKDVVSFFRKLIDCVAADWEKPLAQIQLVDVDKIAQVDVLADQNPVSEELVTQRFDRQLTGYANHIAIQDVNRELTYGDLDNLITQITYEIDLRKIGPRQRIAVCLTRSAEAVAAMFGVLRSGNAFVPVDPAWPQTRIEYILEDCQAACIVSNSDQPIPDQFDSIRLNLDQVGSSQNSSSSAVPSVIRGSDTAYILYTSGSTGKPKGVEIGHAALAHYVNWAESYYCTTPPHSFPLFTPLTFDLTLTSVFVPLISGGKIVVYRERLGGQDTALIQVLEDNLVDIIKLTPSHLSLLAGQQFESSAVRQLILGGEDLSSDLARKTFATFAPGLKIHNEYGPTEATVGCIVHTIDSQSILPTASVPIGVPIPGTAALVVNEQLQIQPNGVPGELCILGNGLAAGYINRPDLTAENFIESGSFQGRRAYRTGDIARINEHGLFEYLRRVDDQVKIRGARIELTAIESALREHPRIKDAVVNSFLTRSASEPNQNCSRCGLASNFPGTEFDEKGICNQCRSFDGYHENAQAYFRTMDDLRDVLNPTGNSTAPFDCLALLSGGKDSTYMLARLVDLDLQVLAFTLDNGYISEEAKSNIRRVTQTLGVQHVFGSTPHMNQIFVDSLKRFSNVCQGCFKTIYTLATNLALEKKIPFIVTGLSRGQLFETRLTEELFRDPCDNLVQIDESVLEARKAYHRIPDAVFEYLDVSELQKSETFEKVQYVDFYRYCDVKLEDMLDYLKHKLPWIRPADTGRSTNCLINDVGIYVHKRNEGFHNYTMPYSWDVRMDHKTRDEAVDELRDRINVDNVHQILSEIGFDGELSPQDKAARLAAYFTSDGEVETEEIKHFLRQRLPEFMLPSRFVRIETVPLSENGKVDRSKLPDVRATSVAKQNTYVAPKGPMENRIVEIWQGVLGLAKIGVQDNFFDLGGDSILAIQIVAKANQLGIQIKPADMFETLTVENLALRAGALEGNQSTYEQEVEQRWLSPIQQWMLGHKLDQNDFWTQSIELALPGHFTESNIPQLQGALSRIVKGNPALRTRVRVDGTIEQTAVAEPFDLRLVDSEENQSGQSDESCNIETELSKTLSFSSDQVIAGRLIRYAENEFRLLLMANHLAVDAISWQRIVFDLNEFIANGESESWQPQQAASFASWTQLLRESAAGPFLAELDDWQRMLKAPVPSFKTERSENSAVSRYALARRSVSAETLAKIESALGPLRLSMHEFLLSAFAMSVSAHTGKQEFRIFVEGHGREPLDPNRDYSRTIGWFTSLYPICFQLPGVGDENFVARLKEQIRAVPTAGLGFGVLKFLSSDSRIRNSLSTTETEVIFNYLGKRHTDQHAEVKVSRPLKLHRSQGIRRQSALEFNVLVNRGLEIEIEFSCEHLSEEKIFGLLDEFEKNLVSLLKSAANDSALSSSDFPLANLDVKGLSDLAAALKKSDKKG